MPKLRTKKNDAGWIPAAGPFDYTKARKKWRQDEAELLAALKQRSAERKRRKAS